VTTEAKPPTFWGTEDGDSWFADGHHDRGVSIEAVKRHEEEVSGEVFEELAGAIERGDLTVEHYWVIECDQDDEVFHVVAEGTKGAQPMTMVKI
jgi:hypothetical protein